MLIYDDTSDLCTARIAELWGQVSYFPGAVPASSLPKQVFNLTQKELKNKIWYLSERRVYSEYEGFGIIYMEQRNFMWSIFGWMHFIFPFNVLIFGRYVLRKALQPEKFIGGRNV